jgi:hypothetical protein
MHPNQLRLVESGATSTGGHASGGHVVQFYEHNDFLIGAVADYLAEGLIAGQPCVVIASEHHREAFVARLRAKGFDLDLLTSSGRLELLDAHETLAEFMIVNSPSPQRFNAVVGGLLARVSRSHGNATVRAYGEMVDVLWDSANSVGALRLEELWNSLTETHDFTLFCAYAMGHFYKAGSAESLRAICERHTHVQPVEPATETLAAERRIEMGLLQERIKNLELELRAREERERELQAALRRLGIKPAS